MNAPGGLRFGEVRTDRALWRSGKLGPGDVEMGGNRFLGQSDRGRASLARSDENKWIQKVLHSSPWSTRTEMNSRAQRSVARLSSLRPMETRRSAGGRSNRVPSTCSASRSKRNASSRSSGMRCQRTRRQQWNASHRLPADHRFSSASTRHAR